MYHKKTARKSGMTQIKIQGIKDKNTEISNKGKKLK